MVLKLSLVALAVLLGSGCVTGPEPAFCGARCVTQLPGQPAPDWYALNPSAVTAANAAKTAYNAGQPAIATPTATWAAPRYRISGYSALDVCLVPVDWTRRLGLPVQVRH